MLHLLSGRRRELLCSRVLLLPGRSRLLRSLLLLLLLQCSLLQELLPSRSRR